MEPKPVITIFGDIDLIGPVMQRKLQTKFKSLQRDGYSKDETAFASFCNGVEFLQFQIFCKNKKEPSYLNLVHQEPTLHTFWTDCSETSMYNSVVCPNIKQWISDVNKIKGSDKLLIVYCVTAEVRSRRPKMKTSKLEPVEDLVNKDFRNKCSIINLRLASADQNRIVESFTNFTNEVNRLSLNNFLSNVSVVANELKGKRIQTVFPEEVYDLICRKLSVAIAYEMIREPLQASLLYALSHEAFEFAMTKLSQRKNVPPWLVQIEKIEIQQWDYPHLADTQIAWKYLPDILTGKAHILYIWTFLFVRRIHTLCGRGLIEGVYDCCVQTLHCIARIINCLKLLLPPGVFNSWAYMSCLECVESMMVKIDPEILATTSSATLILVRAELWHYAWEKLRAVGLLCHLLPGSQITGDPKDTIIDTICAGIPINDDIKADDQGLRLTDVLKSKEKFKNAFMSLGEMVIGAFKHAGRRRMAFSIGTRMAEFHKEVGMVREAEQLLCDVTSLHSVQHWPQLSSSAYSILAHCQQKLRQEDKEVYSLLVLVTTPKHENSTHDPAHYMDQLIHIGEKSHYQKLLSWEPLFYLNTLTFESLECHRGEPLSLKMTLDYHGPKAIRLTMASVIFDPISQNQTVSMVTDKSSSYEEATDFFTEISLDPGPKEEELLTSRRIGGDEGSKLHKVYYSSSHLSNEDDECIISSNYRLVVMDIMVVPGMNTITLSGKMTIPGSYLPHQIILKAGALDFCLVVPMATSQQATVNILPDKVDISVALKPQSDVIIAGVTIMSQLTITTGDETTINEGAKLALVAPPTVELEPVGHGSPVITNQLNLTLSSVVPSSAIMLSFGMTFSSQYQNQSTLPTTLHDHDNTEYLSAWQYELEVHCNWLNPPHVARLPVIVYEPFTFSHNEYSAGESTFFQILIVNSCPLPLYLDSHALLAPSLDLIPLNGSIPKVFYPGDTFSFLWQHKKGSIESMSMLSGCFRIYYHPEYDDSNTLSCTAEYIFMVSNMETIYHLKVRVESLFPLQPVTQGQPVFIIYTISNKTKDFRDSNQQCPDKLHYTLHPDSTYWSVTSSKKGVIDAPLIAESVSFKVAATPKQVGSLLPPSCSLALERFSRVEGTDEVDNVKESEWVKLTGAQCYDDTQRYYVNVISGGDGQQF